MRYLITLKTGITYIFSHYFEFLPIVKGLTLDNVIALIKSVLSNDKNHYYCKIFLD